jgi:glycosyltransferase involved in cell wall biosynthesis
MRIAQIAHLTEAIPPRLYGGTGLILIEAMACGTPVIAFNRGAVPEIVEDGVTGFVVEDEREAVVAAHRLPRLSRGAIRRRFEERFTARRMARNTLSSIAA